MQTATRTTKTNRTFTFLRRHGWALSVLIGAGGLYFPRLGLLVPGIMGALLVTGVFRGRYWCGNICFHGSFFDRALMPLSPERRIPRFFRSPILAAAVLGFFLFQMGRRLWSVWGADPGTMPPLDRIGAIFSGTYLVVLVAGALLGLLFHSRTWCRFCPMGTAAGLLHRWGKKTGLSGPRDRVLGMTEPARCRRCGQCARVCPVQLEPWQGHHPDCGFGDPRCIRCGVCVRHCPPGILQLMRPPAA